MSRNSSELVLPRPGGDPDSPKLPISGPTETAFTDTFGALLPPAKYLKTAVGKAAYYELLPSSNAAGSPTPDRVLFIHGVQTPALGMWPLAHTLHQKYPQAHFVLIDLWGHGLSDTPIAPHDKHLFHRLIDTLLDELNWPTAHLVGYSFGGALTVGYVASRSARVQSFTIVAPAGLIRAANLSKEEHAHLRGEDEDAARKWVLEWLEGGQLVVPTDWQERVAKGEVIAEAVKEWQMREHPGHTASVVAVVRDGAVMDNDADFVGAVQTGLPSLAILGGLDGVCNKEDLYKLGISNIVVVPQVGHGVVREKETVPDVAEAISDFWSKLS